MHDLTNSVLHLPSDSVKLRCCNCKRTLLVRNGADVMVRMSADQRPSVLLVSGASIKIGCFECGTFNCNDVGSDEMLPCRF